MTTNAPAEAAVEGLRDIKPPLETFNVWLWIAIAAAAMLAITLIVVVCVLYFRRKVQVRLPPPIAAHIRARQKLEDALAFIGDPKSFCILVSDTIRVYLEERFDFHAPERTTEEFLHELRGTDLLLPDQKESLGEFLQSCDLVKFARYEPGETKLRALHAAALRLVDETEPQPIDFDAAARNLQPAGNRP